MNREDKIKAVANYLEISDLKNKEEKLILKKIWNAEFQNYKEKTVLSYEKFLEFVNREIYKNSSANYKEECIFIDRILGNTRNENEILNENQELYNKERDIKIYFKTIQLQLIYNEKMKYKRLKFKTILKEFGYKRRSLKLTTTLKVVLQDLNLKTYIKKHKLCDIENIKIDDNISIRFEE